MIDLYNGDCLEVMDKLINDGVKVDLILTDPPYELTNHGGTKSKMAQRAAKVRDEIDFIAQGFDYKETFEKFLQLQKTANMLIFCSNKQVSKTMSFFEYKKLSVTLLEWKKTNPSPLCNGKYVSDVEYVVYVRGKNAPWNNNAPLEYKYKVQEYPVVSSKERNHPTPKPVGLLERYLEVHSFENMLVFDPFMGGGSTGVACKKLNRNFIGIELDKKKDKGKNKNQSYFDLAKERIEKADISSAL